MSQNLIQFKVTGDVQGVNFRSYTQKEAQKLGLKGHVYNHDDSSVQGVAVGPPDKIKQFQSFLSQGPSAAEVHKVELIQNKSDASEEEIKKALGGSGGFEIRR
ncbi:hypothetical protein I203_108061 [Kwoniella mangroviensis CBS 8507]|uniref:hypothetical protein n=1 Tax=Kwoniella mangroviensis CBS 8507 TaxID=1296122 RepID=UPI00080D775D|nr:uncharacterized protein I203_04955 [Kwoniella mangroviensis CBS 8507]OCF65935.1 hypothetical protein I203_04955 [Kwoniella mangroviensis CBS 8507]